MRLVDISVLTRLAIPEVAGALRPLLESGVVATCAVVELRLLAGIADPVMLDTVARLRSAAFRWLSTDDADLRTAIRTQHTLAEAGYPGVGWPQLVVAAVAHRHEAAILHYDHDYDRVAKVTGQDTRWVVPEDSV